MKIYIGLLVSILIFSCSQGRDRETAAFPQEVTVAVDSFFMDKVNRKELAGAVTLIVKDGKVQHLKGYGCKDLENEILMDTDVLIPIASMTKGITSIAVLQQVEGGKLQLDDPVEKYLPQFRDIKVLIKPDSMATEEPASKLTIRDLLRHTAGIVYGGGSSVTDRLYKEAGFHTWNKPLSLFIEEIAKIPLAAQPGTKWQYGYPHDVLGYLVEVVSGKTLDIYFKEHIFEPLGLEDTGFYVHGEKSARLSNLYEYSDGQLKVEDARNHSIYNQLPEALSGGGGWWSSYGGVVTTVSDFRVIADMLLHFGEYKGKRILSKESVQEMITNQLAHLPDSRLQFGFGVGVTPSEEDPAVTKEIYWSGAPYNTYYWVDYQEKMICILFTNTSPYRHLNMMNTFKELVQKRN